MEREKSPVVRESIHVYSNGHLLFATPTLGGGATGNGRTSIRRGADPAYHAVIERFEAYLPGKERR